MDGLERAQELARACRDSRVVTACDREGDVRELLSRTEQTGAALLVRASPGGAASGAAGLGRRRGPVGACAGDGPGGRAEDRGSCLPGVRTVRAAVRRSGPCAARRWMLPPKDRESEPPVRMIAVPALEEDPPRCPALPASKKRKTNQPLHWMLLTNEGQADLDTARTVLRWFELRWRIERFFHALKVGTRIEDRRLDEADDLRRCLAFDANTAFRVRDRSLLAREGPDDPASRQVTENDIQALCALASFHGFKVPRRPPDMTIAGFVVLTGDLAGFHPSKRQPLPGMQKLWEGVKFLSHAVIAIPAMQEWNRQERKENSRRQE